MGRVLDVVGVDEEAGDVLYTTFTLPVAAWDVEAEEQVVERFEFRAVQPMAVTLELARRTLPNGRVGLQQMLEFLEGCMREEDLARWREYTGRDSLVFSPTVVVDMFQAVQIEYAERPTMPRSGSNGGTARTKRTSAAGSGARASTSRPSR